MIYSPAPGHVGAQDRAPNYQPLTYHLLAWQPALCHHHYSGVEPQLPVLGNYSQRSYIWQSVLNIHLFSMGITHLYFVCGLYIFIT